MFDLMVGVPICAITFSSYSLLAALLSLTRLYAFVSISAVSLGMARIALPYCALTNSIVLTTWLWLERGSRDLRATLPRAALGTHSGAGRDHLQLRDSVLRRPDRSP